MKPLPKGCSVALIVLAVVAVLLVAAGLFYGPKLKSLAHERVLDFLRNEGLFVEYQTKYGRLDGAITLVDIVAYDTSAKQKRVASLDRLVIRIALRDLVRKQIVRTLVSTREATFTMFGDPKTGNTAFEHLNLDFDCRSGLVQINRLSTLFQGVELHATGEVQIDHGAGQPKAALAKMATTPLDFSPVLRLAPALDYRKAKWTPRIDATVKGSHSTMKDSSWDVQVKTDSFPSKGVKLDLNGRVVTGKNGNVTIDNVQLKHSSGEANFAGAIVKGTDTLEIRRLDSTLDWIALVRDHPAQEAAWKPLTVTQPPHINASGSYHLVKPELSKMTFSLGKFAVQYQVKDGKLVSIPELTAPGTLDKGILRVNPLTAFLAKGNATGEVTYTPFAEVPAWSANLKGTHFFLPDLVPPKGGRQLLGYVDFSFNGQGAQKPEALQGKGNFAITSGDFFHTRVFGPLLQFLHKLSNNPDKGKTQELHASFTIVNGVLTTKDLALDISEAHVQASGTMDFVKQTARFDAQAKLRGPLGLTVDLIGEGPFDKVEWRKK